MATEGLKGQETPQGVFERLWEGPGGANRGGGGGGGGGQGETDNTWPEYVLVTADTLSAVMICLVYPFPW